MKKLSLTDRLDSFYAMEHYRSRQHAEEARGRLKEIKAHLPEIIEVELTARQRQIVMLYYYGSYTMDQIAAQLQINKSTVCRHLMAARANIERLLKYSCF